MAAPTLVTRTTPTGYKMPEGFRATIAFANAPGLNFWEKTVKPGGMDGGDPIDTTTQHNSRVMTQEPPTLIKHDTITSSGAFDPDSYSTVRGLINVNQSITVKWPTGATLTFYGWLRKVEWGDLKHKEQPEQTITVEVSNWDPVNRVEVEPVFVPAAGT